MLLYPTLGLTIQHFNKFVRTDTFSKIYSRHKIEQQLTYFVCNFGGMNDKEISPSRISKHCSRTDFCLVNILQCSLYVVLCGIKGASAASF
jgi:hypothetical protein